MAPGLGGDDLGGDGPGGLAAAGPGRVLGRRAGLRLWVGLPTLVGADRRPGELLGWGPVHAELAADLARSLPSWWCVLTGADHSPQAGAAHPPPPHHRHHRHRHRERGGRGPASR